MTDPGITSIPALDAADFPLPILYLAAFIKGTVDYTGEAPVLVDRGRDGKAQPWRIPLGMTVGTHESPDAAHGSIHNMNGWGRDQDNPFQEVTE